MSRVFEQPNAADINNRWKSRRAVRGNVCTGHLRRLRADKLAACKTLAKSASETPKRWLGRTRTNSETCVFQRRRYHTRATELLTFTELLLSSELSAADLQSVQCCRQRGHRRPAALSHATATCALAAALRDSSGT